jgi:transposase InsO family protein
LADHYPTIEGNCLDNAPMESFFHTLKVERVHHRTYVRPSGSKGLHPIPVADRALSSAR